MRFEIFFSTWLGWLFMHGSYTMNIFKSTKIHNCLHNKISFFRWNAVLWWKKKLMILQFNDKRFKSSVHCSPHKIRWFCQNNSHFNFILKKIYNFFFRCTIANTFFQDCCRFLFVLFCLFSIYLPTLAHSIYAAKIQ